MHSILYRTQNSSQRLEESLLHLPVSDIWSCGHRRTVTWVNMQKKKKIPKTFTCQFADHSDLHLSFPVSKFYAN